MGKIKEEFSYVLWMLEALLKSGMSFETAIKEVSSLEYLKISKIFRELLYDAKRMGMLNALKKLGKKNPRLFGKFVSEVSHALQTGNVSETLSLIVKSRLEDEKINAESYIKKIQFLSNAFLMIAVLVPTILFPFSGLFQAVQTFSGEAFEVSFLVQIFNLSLFASIMVLIIIVIYTKFLEVRS
jgi:pilus assembly protein TadC